MKHIKIFILALISCITLTSCPSDGNDDIVPKDPTEEGTGDNTGGNNGDNTGGNTGDNTGDNTGGNTGGNNDDNTGGNTGDNTGGNTASNIEDLHNGTSNKPAYIPQH